MSNGIHSKLQCVPALPALSAAGLAEHHSSFMVLDSELTSPPLCHTTNFLHQFMCYIYLLSTWNRIEAPRGLGFLTKLFIVISPHLKYVIAVVIVIIFKCVCFFFKLGFPEVQLFQPFPCTGFLPRTPCPAAVLYRPSMLSSLAFEVPSPFDPARPIPTLDLYWHLLFAACVSLNRTLLEKG